MNRGARTRAAEQRFYLPASLPISENNGKIHRYDDAADHDAQEQDHHRFESSKQVLHGRVHFVLVEVGDFLKHRVHRAGLFADADHLGDHAGEYVGFLEWIDERAARLRPPFVFAKSLFRLPHCRKCAR